jgi:hypothetical protein
VPPQRVPWTQPCKCHSSPTIDTGEMVEPPDCPWRGHCVFNIRCECERNSVTNPVNIGPNPLSQAWKWPDCYASKNPKTPQIPAREGAGLLRCYPSICGLRGGAKSAAPWLSSQPRPKIQDFSSAASNNQPAPKAFGAPRHCVSPSVGKEAPSPLHHFCTISAPFPAQFLFSALVYESLTTNSPLHGAVSPARAAFKRSPGCLEQSNQSISAPFRQA